VTVENYPELKANENFLQLQAQLEGTENRISVERRRFNETVQTYNTTIKRFPNTIFASVFGFQQKQYFQSTAGSETPPKVEF
jgi:LemA protein